MAPRTRYGRKFVLIVTNRCRKLRIEIAATKITSTKVTNILQQLGHSTSYFQFCFYGQLRELREQSFHLDACIPSIEKAHSHDHVRSRPVGSLNNTSGRLYFHLDFMSPTAKAIGTNMCSLLQIHIIAKHIEQRTLLLFAEVYTTSP